MFSRNCKNEVCNFEIILFFKNEEIWFPSPVFCKDEKRNKIINGFNMLPERF